MEEIVALGIFEHGLMPCGRLFAAHQHSVCCQSHFNVLLMNRLCYYIDRYR